MKFTPRTRWYHGLDEMGKALWDSGFHTTLIRSEKYKPKFDPYEWYRKDEVSSADQVRRSRQVEGSDFLSNAMLLSTSEGIDNLSMLWAIQIAKRAIAANNTVMVVDLGDPEALAYVRHEFTHRDGADLVVAHNFTIGSTRERAQVARDFALLGIDAMRILVTVGKPIEIARKMYFNRFAGAFYQGQVMYETRAGDRTARRTIRTEER